MSQRTFSEKELPHSDSIYNRNKTFYEKTYRYITLVLHQWTKNKTNSVTLVNLTSLQTVKCVKMHSIQTLPVSVFRCVSIFFVEFQLHFKKDYSTTAWIHSMIDSITMLCGKNQSQHLKADQCCS